MSNHGKRWQHEGRRRAKRLLPRLEMLEHRVVLSTFTVNTTLDTVAANLQTGKDASGHVSLRSAIMAADARGGSNKIVVPAGTFTLSIAPTGNDDVTSGDLNITGNLTITGKGVGKTIIDGNNLDRVFDIESGKVTMTGMTIQHGRVTGGGGGILNNGGQLSLSSVMVANNVAVGGTGLFGNGIGGAGGKSLGGGIFNEAGSLTLTKATITSNQAIGGNGANGGVIIFVEPAVVSDQNGGAVVGNNGFDAGQGSAGEGGGIFNAAGATVSLNGATITSNQAIGGKGGAGTVGFDATGGAGAAGGNATGGNGGNGTQANRGGIGGEGVGGAGGRGGNGGAGDGGGIFNGGGAT